MEILFTAELPATHQLSLHANFLNYYLISDIPN